MVKESHRATWAIHLFTQCPNCDEDVDLLDFADFWTDNPNLGMGEHGTPTSTDITAVCPECEVEFLVTLEY